MPLFPWRFPSSSPPKPNRRYQPHLTKGWIEVLRKDIEEAAAAAVEHMLARLRAAHGPGVVTRETAGPAYASLGDMNARSREVQEAFWDWLREHGKPIKERYWVEDPEHGEMYDRYRPLDRDSKAYRNYVLDSFDPSTLRKMFDEAAVGELGKTYRGASAFRVAARWAYLWGS